MTKAEQRRKNNSDGLTQKSESRPWLERAFWAYESGDMVLTRRLLTQAKGHLEASEEESAARKVGKTLFTTNGDVKTFTAQSVAEELWNRTNVPWKSYGFAALAMAIISLMVLLSHFRGAWE